MLQAVKRLVPEDRVLKHDCDRFVAHVRPPAFALPSRRSSQRIHLLKIHQLSRRTSWIGAFADGDAFLP